MVPSNCRIANVVSGDLVEMRALIGEVDVIFWYRNGIPTSARRTGFNKRRDEMVSSGVPANATKDPRRVKRSCEGDNVTERSE